MLPNLPWHPIIVHFPIALLIVGFFMDLAGLALKKSWLNHAALVLLIIGALGTFAAARTGEAEEDAILETPPIHDALELHEDSGKLTMWFFLLITAARGGLTWRKKFTPAVHWIFLVVWAVGAVLLVRTAFYGGELVYHHGAGVATRISADAEPGTADHD